MCLHACIKQWEQALHFPPSGVAFGARGSAPATGSGHPSSSPVLFAAKAWVSKEADSWAPSTGESSLHSAPLAPPCHLWRELPPSGENIISFPAYFRMFILFLFSLHKGFLKGTSSFGKPAVTQKNLLVLSPMQVKQPKKHDSYNKLIPYSSSPIPCVSI